MAINASDYIQTKEKNIKLQATQAKLISQQNKLLASRNDVINAELEINRISAEYAEKLSKSQSEKPSEEPVKFQETSSFQTPSTSDANLWSPRCCNLAIGAPSPLRPASPSPSLPLSPRMDP